MAIYFIGLIMPVVKVAGESSKPRDGSKTCKTAGLLTYVSSFCGHQVLKGYWCYIFYSFLVPFFRGYNFYPGITTILCKSKLFNLQSVIIMDFGTDCEFFAHLQKPYKTEVLTFSESIVRKQWHEMG